MSVSNKSIDIKNNFLFFMIVIFSFIIIIINYIWLINNKTPPPWDQAWYLQTSEILYKSWTKGGIISLLGSFSQAMGIKAPLLSILPLPFYLIFGNSELSAMYVNIVFFLLLSIYLFLLVEVISNNKKIAFLSVIITQTIPQFYALNRQFFVEYGLTTFVVIFIYFLIKSDMFQSKKFNYGIGIILGLGLLMKVNFPIYIVMPVLWVIFIRYKQKKDIFSYNFIIEMFRILFIGTLICSIWYIRNFNTVIPFAFSAGFGELGKLYGSSNIFSLQVISDFYKQIFINNFSLYYFILLIICCLYYIIHKFISKERNNKNQFNLVLFLWFIFPLIINTFTTNRDTRYLMPIFPVLSIFMSYIIYLMFKNIHKEIIFVLLSFSIITTPLISMIRNSFYIQDKNLANSLLLPDKSIWKLDEIIEYIYKSMMKDGLYSSLNIIAVEHKILNYNTFLYLTSIQNLNYPVEFSSLGYAVDNVDQAIKNIINLNPYMILYEEGISENELAVFLNKCNYGTRQAIDNKELPYKKDNIFMLPNNVKAILYKRMTVIEKNSLNESYVIEKYPIMLLNELSKALKKSENESYISETSFNVNNDIRNVIFEHPPVNSAEYAEIKWRNIVIKNNSYLKFGIVINPSTWEYKNADGVRFIIEVKTINIDKIIFDKYIDPRNNTNDRKWFDYKIDLIEFANKKIELILKTQNGGKNNYYDHAGWSNPIIDAK